MTYYCELDWPLGRLLLMSDGASLTGVFFDDGRGVPARKPEWQLEPHADPFPRARAELQEYWEGRRRDFTVPLAPRGTAFQQRVWTSISGVPFGETITYAALAERVGSAGASRAAGLATGRNPISLIIPCHRIVGSNGSLTGYGGGLDRKRALLRFETAVASGRDAKLQQELALISE